MSDLSKVEFRYFGYWDVPRFVVARVGDRVMFLDSRFDDIADDFGPFDVYEMDAADAPAIVEALKADDIDLSKARFLGTVPATVDLFDPTRHHYIDLDLVRSRLRTKGQWPTPSYPWEHSGKAGQMVADITQVTPIEFLECFRIAVGAKGRRAAWRPTLFVEAWKGFVHEVVSGYLGDLYEYENELSVRDDLERALTDKRLDAYPGWSHYRADIAAVDAELKEALRSGPVVRPGAAWWRERLPVRASTDFAEDAARLFGGPTTAEV